jgi:hypothetical protein
MVIDQSLLRSLFIFIIAPLFAKKTSFSLLTPLEALLESWDALRIWLTIERSKFGKI